MAEPMGIYSRGCREGKNISYLFIKGKKKMVNWEDSARRVAAWVSVAGRGWLLGGGGRGRKKEFEDSAWVASGL